MKKNKFVSVYSVIAPVILVLSLLFVVISLSSEYVHSEGRTRTIFDEACFSVRNELKKENAPSYANLGEILGSVDNYAFINIKINGKNLILYPLQDSTAPSQSKLIKEYSYSTKVGENNLFITASLYRIKPASIVYYSKCAFIIILIITLCTILLIVYLTVSEKDLIDEDISTEEEDEEDEEDEEEIQEEEKNEAEPEIKIENNGTEKEECNFVEIPEEIIEFSKEAAEIVSEEENNTEKEINIEEENKETAEPEKPVELPVTDIIPSEIVSENPQGLFSPESGFGWESYLNTRLDNELVRASSSEMDLSLFLIKLDGMERKGELFEKISEVLINAFQFKDMIFEYKEDCLAAIKTNTTIDEAIPLADQIHSEISKVLKDTDIKCLIGLTSKTIRMINSERLIKEADAALEHSISDAASPITAFRANAEKYMKFVDQKD